MQRVVLDAALELGLCGRVQQAAGVVCELQQGRPTLLNVELLLDPDVVVHTRRDTTQR